MLRWRRKQLASSLLPIEVMCFFIFDVFFIKLQAFSLFYFQFWYYFCVVVFCAILSVVFEADISVFSNIMICNLRKKKTSKNINNTDTEWLCWNLWKLINFLTIIILDMKNNENRNARFRTYIACRFFLPISLIQVH